MVAESKAYCSDCGTPMDEEQKRNGSSEFDSQMKTQNFTLSSFYNIKKIVADESKPTETEAKAVKSKTVESEVKPIQTNAVDNKTKSVRFNAADNLTKTIYLSPLTDTKINTEQPNNIAVEQQNESYLSESDNSSVNAASNSKRTFYIIGGIIVLLFSVLAVLAVIILGFLYWN